MKFSMKTGSKIFAFFSFLVISTFLFSQSIPEQLNEAKEEINRAVELGAEKNASDDLSEAKNLIEEADQQFSSGDTEGAIAKANQSKEAAVRAAMTSAPIHVKELKDTALKAINDLEGGNSEENLASSKNLYNEGDALLKKAEESTNADDSNAALNAYMQAAKKFDDSYSASEELLASSSSEDASGSNGDDALSLKASEIEVKIQKAREYGAEKAAAEDLNAAETALAEANSALETGKAEEAVSRLNLAEEKADLAFEKSISRQAEARKNEAEKEVQSAKSAFDQKQITDSTLQDYMNAANEALQSAKERIAEQQYEESIKDSSEALNLARVLKDQIVAQNDSGSGSEQGVPYGGGPGSGSATSGEDTGSGSSQASSSSQDYKEYTVKSKRPSDCLWRIAAYEFHYGKGKYWKKIYEANKGLIKNPNLIRPGMVLRIPAIPGTSGFKESAPPAEEQPAEEQPAEEPSVQDDQNAVKEESDVQDDTQPNDDQALPAEDEHSPQEQPAEEDNAVTPEESAAPSDENAPEEDTMDSEEDQPEETPADEAAPEEEAPAEEPAP